MIMLAITKVKTTDEGEYRVVIENCHGTDEKAFMLYVSGKLVLYILCPSQFQIKVCSKINVVVKLFFNSNVLNDIVFPARNRKSLNTTS